MKFYTKLRALLPTLRRPPLPMIATNDSSPASADLRWDGHCHARKCPPTKVHGRTRRWFFAQGPREDANRVGRVAVMAFAVFALSSAPAEAFPPPSSYVDHVLDSVHGQRVEFVRAAFQTIHGNDPWSFFNEDEVRETSSSDRVSLQPYVNGTRKQRRDLVDFLLTEPRFARVVLGAYYYNT